MKGIGRTVFSGTKVEDFEVEVLGVLENSGPNQSIILGKLSGGPLERTGVMQGMSGSPVYIGGKLMGAVALAFPFAKEAIAGIRPIQEMLDASAPATARVPAIRASLSDKTLIRPLLKAERSITDTKPIEIATPLSLSGFTPGTLEHFGEQLRAIGLEPRQAVSGGQSSAPLPVAPLEPGSMISVQLVSGDMNIGADGTVTHVDGNRIYAFGHRFLSLGATELPFARASVLALLSNLSTSFKISSSGGFLGSVTSDLSSAIAGELNRRPQLVPVSIQVNGGGKSLDYHMNMVRDPLLSPLLLQMMLFSSLDATQRSLGSGTIALRGQIQLEGVTEPLRVNNMFAGDYSMPLQAALSAALPVAVALQNSLGSPHLQSINLTVDAFPAKKQMTVENLWTSKRQVRPGETIDLKVLLTSEGGQETTHSLSYQVPIGARTGTLYFTAADGATINAAEQRTLTIAQPQPAERVVTFLNTLLSSEKGLVRVWRADPAFQIEGRDLPGAPPSLSMLLTKSAADPGSTGRTSTLQTLEFSSGTAVIAGSRTVQVEVKE